jgi:hypothetical protein
MRHSTLPHTIVEVSKYVDILFRHRLRFFILLVVLPAELALACVFLFPHVSAASSMWADTPAYIPVSAAASGWNQYLTPAQNVVDSLNQLRSTDAFVHDLGVKLDANNTFRDANERDTVLSTVVNDVLVVADGTHLVVLSYTCPHEPICTNVLKAIEELYQQWVIDQETAQAQVAITFYSGQLATTQSKLDSDEAALNAYLASHPEVHITDSRLNPDLDSLLRQVDTDKAAVVDLQQKLDSTRLQEAATSETQSTVLRVIDDPRVTGGRLSALPKKNMAIAAIGALVAGLGVLVFMGWSDRTTREPRELENILHLPVLVTVPDIALMQAAGDG